MKRRTKRVGITVLVLIGFTALACLFHASLLRAAAQFWVVDTTPEAPVGAIIIPGGGLETRPFGAAKLYHEGLSERLILFSTEVLPSQELGLTRPSHEVALEVLGKLEVPAKSIEVIYEAVTSTQDEVNAIRDWAERTETPSILVVTDVFPSRRVLRAYRRGLAGLDLDIHVHTVPARLYEVETWWESEHGLIAFQNEVIKYFYYLFRY